MLDWRPKDKIIRVEQDDNSSELLLYDDKRVFFNQTPQCDHSELLAEALYHLSLLSHDAEEALGISIRAHQKLEWQLEYDNRVGTVK